MSQTYRIQVSPQTAVASTSLLTAAHQFGFTTIRNVFPTKLYFIKGDLNAQTAEHVARELLSDPVTEKFTISEPHQISVNRNHKHIIDVTLLPGVTDPAAENLIHTAKVLGVNVSQAATGQSYLIEADQADEESLTRLAETVLSNPVIQQTALDTAIAPPFVSPQESDGLVETIPVRDANDDELVVISQERRLSLNLAEMQVVRSYYQEEEREPTDLELEMLAQTWSEHCVHKTFRAKISYTGPDSEEPEIIDGILKTYLRAATDKVAKPWVKSAFVDNAGIVAFTDEYDLAFKVETHNHPSALDPFGGANTGIGGVVRDIIGVSARPIANTDILCFGDQDMPADKLPEGVLHPRRVQTGVIAGIEDYGNKMGIPTVNGTIVYDNGYTANPLVYCGCLGILPIGSHKTDPQVGDLVVAIGGRTGRDGLRGATFSSMDMDTSTSDIASTAVQIGHPIMEKQTLEVILRARDEELYTAITDCGAGGFSSAVGEMSEELGARIQLENMPVKYPGLRPWELWLSEAQERMVLAVPPENEARIAEICAGQNVEYTILGEFTGDGRLQIFHGDRLVGDLQEAFLHDGLPQREMTAVWEPAPVPEQIPPAPPIPAEAALFSLLKSVNIRSKEDVVRQYDHEVQAGTAVKPFVGYANHGPSDGAVLVPLDTQKAEIGTHKQKAVALSNGICPQFSAVDPYNMAWAAIDEAMRNAIAVGADPDQIAILDNFCWGNPSLPDRLGSLVRCSQGCYDAAVAYGTPYVSGKDSLYNEYLGADGEKHAIPGTLLISAMGIVPDVSQTATMDFKAPWEQIYVIGTTKNELSASHYAMLQNMHPSLSSPPTPVDNALTILRTMHQAIQQGLVTAVHDCSEGGLAVTLAEMALAGGYGAKVNLSNIPSDQPLDDNTLLFAESLTRFVVTVNDDQEDAFNSLLRKNGIAKGHVGFTTPNRFHVRGQDGTPLIKTNVAQLDEAFRGHTTTSDRFATVETEPVQTAAPMQIASLEKAPKVLILHANGTNRDRDAALACEMAGGAPEIVHINQLIGGEHQLLDYNMLVIPGGFSYGDDLGAGVLWAADLRHMLGNQLTAFAQSGRPVLGICNGFQVLVKSGLLDLGQAATDRPYTLTYNAHGRFECRWSKLIPNADSKSIFTQGLTEPIYCPVAHGEGRFMVRDEATVAMLTAQNRIAITYSDDEYPLNPNGSINSIAGISNQQGNVMGLMPHPEDHIFPWQHPRHHRGERGMLGLSLFINGIKNA